MDTTRSQGAPGMFRSRRPVAALSLAFLIATPFGISPVFASATPSVAPATLSGERVIGNLQLDPVYEDTTGAVALGARSGGFSSSPGMYPPDPSAPSAPTVSDLSVTGLPADRGTPSGGFSSAPGMSPDTTVPRGVAPATLTGPVAVGSPSGGFSSAPGMYDPDPSARSAPAVSDLGVTGLPADRGTPNGGFSSAPGMSPDTAVPPADSRQP